MAAYEQDHQPIYTDAANEANRAAFAEEYGVELPETEAKTRQVLREMTTQQRAAQAPATATENATVEAQKYGPQL